MAARTECVCMGVAQWRTKKIVRFFSVNMAAAFSKQALMLVLLIRKIESDSNSEESLAAIQRRKRMPVPNIGHVDRVVHCYLNVEVCWKARSLFAGFLMNARSLTRFYNVGVVVTPRTCSSLPLHEHSCKHSISNELYCCTIDGIAVRLYKTGMR